MSRKKRSDEALRKDSHHVLYEIEQLNEAVKLLASMALTDAEVPRSVKNLLLENIVLHARGLIEFIYGNPDTAREDDIIAADFLPSWPEDRPDMSDFLGEVKRRADKEMMHLTAVDRSPTRFGSGATAKCIVKLQSYSVYSSKRCQQTVLERTFGTEHGSPCLSLSEGAT
jgi:hypothetical protein